MRTPAPLAALVLVFGALSVSVAGGAYAQDAPDAFLEKIALEADAQIADQLEDAYGSSVPPDVQQLYDRGHAAVVALGASLGSGDAEGARQNFLSAMGYFKQVAKTIAAPATLASSASGGESDRDLQSELNRLDRYFQKLRSISEQHDTGIDLSGAEEMFAKAQQQIARGDAAGAGDTIEKLKSLVGGIERDIHEHAAHAAADREKAFALEQIKRISAVLERAESADPGMPEIAAARTLIGEINTALSEDRLSDAKDKCGRLTQIVKTIEGRTG